MIFARSSRILVSGGATVLFAALSLSAVATRATAQTLPFAMQVQQGTSTSTVFNSGSISISSATLGQTSTATLTVTYTGSGKASLSGAALSGAPDFSLSSGGGAVLSPGQTYVVTIQFKPTVTTTEFAQLTIGYSDSGSGLSGNILLNLIGSTPTLTVTYTLPTNQNTVTLNSGGTLQFPPTIINTTITANIVVSNSGTGSGTIKAVTVTGAAYQVLGLSALPTTIGPGFGLAFSIKYSPTQVQTDTGTLTMDFGGTTFSATLSGSGINSTFSYAITTASGDTPFSPNSNVPVPDTNLGTSTSVFIKVRNTGAAAGSIAAITTSGNAYAVTDAPLLPATLNPNDLLTFTLTFTPTQPGANPGKLRVGNDLFNLNANGLGPKYTFTYGATSPVTVVSGGAVIFSPLQVGQTEQVPFTITNGGTTVGTIASIAVADTKGVFKLVSLSGLPLTMNPGDTSTFSIAFTPATTGFSTTTLQVDTQTFNLSGSGTQPTPIPNFQFTGPSGTVNPMQQPAIGLTLAAPYSIPLTGVLTITQNTTAFNADPTVVFSSGGKTVNFTIPANSTQAVFPSGGTQVLLQTGTTAGTITVTPTFATQSGLDLTPPTAPALSLTIAASVPNLLQLQITSVSQIEFTVSVRGYTTPHSLSSLTYNFVGTNGAKASLTVDVSAVSSLWFTSTASQSFGGQFAVGVPFSLPSPSSTLATSGIKSVTVTAANAQGTSNTLSLTLQ